MKIASSSFELKMTPQAFDALYSRGLCVVGSKKLEGMMAEICGRGFALIVSDAEACHDLSDNMAGAKTADGGQNGQNGQYFLTPMGAPSGLIALVFTPAEKKIAEIWLALLNDNDIQHKPHILLIEPTEKERLAQFFAKALADALQGEVQNAGQREAEIVDLRKKTEGLLLDVARQKQLLEAAGRPQYLSAYLPEGPATAGPFGDWQAGIIYQPLPQDLNRLVRFDLYFSAQGKAELRALPVVELIQARSGRLLQRWDQADRLYLDGWQPFQIKEALPAGEGILRIVWPQGSDRHSLRLADAKSYDFAAINEENRDYQGKAIALRMIYQSVTADQALFGFHQRLPEAHYCSFRELSESFAFLGGAPALARISEALGGSPWQKQVEGGAMMLHPAPPKAEGALAAVYCEKFIPLGLGRLQIIASLPSEHADPLVAMVVALKSGQVIASEKITALFEGAELALPADCVAQKRKVSAGETILFDLSFTSLSDYDLILAVKDDMGEVRYGRLLWHGVRFYYDRLPFEGVFKAKKITQASDQTMFVRPLAVRDMVPLLSFWHGETVHEELRTRLGFSPLLILGDRDFMQLHPLGDRLSAVFLDGLIAAGVNGIAFDITTAHEQAPDFLFGMIVFDEASPEARRDIEGFAATLGQELVDGQAFGQQGAVDWVVARVKGGQRDMLNLALQVSPKTRHVMLFTRSIAGDTSFGWCRWSNAALYVPDSMCEDAIGDGRSIGSQSQRGKK